MVNVRKAVATALTKVEKGGGYSNLALNAFLNEYNLSAEDAAFASRLIYGVTERRITLDYYIEKASGRTLNKVSSFVLNTLRVAIYQICYMDKVPDSAAVNEAVNTVKKSRESRAAGFVNAVLRGFLRERPALPEGNTDYALSIRYSCAKWYIHELKEYIGRENVPAFLEDSLLPAPTYIRANTNKITPVKLIENLETTQQAAIETRLNGALKLSLRGALSKIPAFNNGLFHVQDLASQISIAALDIKDNDRILDVCAAPGGKSCTAAEYAVNGCVTSCDIYSARVELIKENAERLGLINLTATVNDATKFNKISVLSTK